MSQPQRTSQPARDALARTHAEAYSALVDFYADVSEELTRIRTTCQELVMLGQLGPEQEVSSLDGVERLRLPLTPLAADASILDVGCGRGDNLLIMRQLGFTRMRGVDVAPQMTAAAAELAGVETRCLDFRTLDPHHEAVDFVFAQALVHLFPRAELAEVVTRLLDLGRSRVYLTTTVHDAPAEGWEEKAEGVLRYRCRYTEPELSSRLGAIVAAHPRAWRGLYFFLVDSFGKRWMNVVLEPTEPLTTRSAPPTTPRTPSH